MYILEIGEELKEIEGFPNYFVTSYGKIIVGPNHRHREYIQLALTKVKGYDAVSLYKGKRYNRRVHTLVAQAFIPNPNNLPTVNHKNGKEKWNNRVDNLEWATEQDQIDHAIKTGLKQFDSDWGIHHDARKKQEKKPYQLLMTLPGKKGKRSQGYFQTKEDARVVRDRICAEHGIVRLAEAA